MPLATFWEGPANGTSFPQFESHLSFVTNPRVQVCGVIQGIPGDEQCEFVQETPACHEGVHYLDYMNFLYCVLNDGKMYFVVKLILIMLMCGYIFIILGSTADTFFCPALAAISNLLGLGENLAGVTLLAFGNGAPDLFTVFANPAGDTELMYAELLGAAAFIIGCIAAIIVMLRPFSVHPAHLVRDVAFFGVASVWIGLAFRNESVTYLEANGAIVIYVLYLAVVIVEHVRGLKKIKRKSILVQYEMSDTLAEQLRTLEERHLFHKREPDDLDNLSLSSESGDAQLLTQFLNAINPIDADEWRDGGWLGCCVCIIKAPINLCLTLIIPCVDETLPLNGWSKLLNTVQVVLMPCAVLLMKQLHRLHIGGVSIFAYTGPVSLVLAAAVFCTSTVDQPPKYHMLFAVFGSFVGSICVISSMAAELVAVLSTLGIVGNLSDSFLGLSVLSWGNSVGDLIANIALARRGYQRMGFAACFGGPLFNTLLGMGIMFNVKIYTSGNAAAAYAREGALGQNCNVFLLLLLICTLVTFALTGWQARRSVGIVMISIYGLFVLYAALGEFEVMHPYGTDHRDEGENEN